MSNFDSISNKKLLWDLLIKNNAFSGLQEKQLSRVQTEFENTISHVSSLSQNSELVDKNKEFLQLMVSKLKLLKQTSNTNVYTAEEILQKKQEELNEEFNKAKSDFEEMTKVQRPEQPNFSDEGKDEPIQNMDSLLEDTMRERNLVEIPQDESLLQKIYNNQIKIMEKLNI